MKSYVYKVILLAAALFGASLQGAALGGRSQEKNLRELLAGPSMTFVDEGVGYVNSLDLEYKQFLLGYIGEYRDMTRDQEAYADLYDALLKSMLEDEPMPVNPRGEAAAPVPVEARPEVRLYRELEEVAADFSSRGATILKTMDLDAQRSLLKRINEYLVLHDLKKSRLDFYNALKELQQALDKSIKEMAGPAPVAASIAKTGKGGAAPVVTGKTVAKPVVAPRPSAAAPVTAAARPGVMRIVDAGQHYRRSHYFTYPDKPYEDKSIIDKAHGVYGVFDGNGKSKAEQASETQATYEMSPVEAMAAVKRQFEENHPGVNFDTQLDPAGLAAYLAEHLPQAIFDAHGDNDGIKDAFVNVQNQINRRTIMGSGSTAVLAQILPDGQLVVANSGDSRALLCKSNGEVNQLSRDHDANTNIGSADFSRASVHVVKQQLERNDSAIILFSDGVYHGLGLTARVAPGYEKYGTKVADDALGNREVCRLVYENPGMSAQNLAELIVNTAYEKQRAADAAVKAAGAIEAKTDDMTAVVIKLGQ